jgi:hypothetical protein
MTCRRVSRGCAGKTGVAGRFGGPGGVTGGYVASDDCRGGCLPGVGPGTAATRGRRIVETTISRMCGVDQEIAETCLKLLMVIR